MAQRTALVIEDSTMLLMALETLLSAHGFEIIGSASTLDKALALARTTTPDIALLDINLRGTMSFPAADVLIERGIPVIFTTGYSPAEVLPPRFALTPCLQKPCSGDALIALVDDILSPQRVGAAKSVSR